jgi:hypothetical protein
MSETDHSEMQYHTSKERDPQLHVSAVWVLTMVQGGSNMTGKNCDLFTHKSSRSYLNHFVYHISKNPISGLCPLSSV